MSFSKAKIQRFNDIKECTPSPAKYNVSMQEKIKLGIISQSGKLVKKIGSCSESETGSVHSTPIFQTPTVPKKKKFLGLGTFKTKVSDHHEELREKIVECSNKDVYIKDLIEQIEELTEKNVNLKSEKLKFLEENKKIKESYLVLQKQQKDVHLKHTELHKQVVEVKQTLHQIRQEKEDLKTANYADLQKLLEYINKFQFFYDQTIEEHHDQMTKKEEKYKEEIHTIKKQLEEELETVKNKLVQSEAKVILLEENFKEVSLLTEMQMKEKLEEFEAEWKRKLEEKEKESEAILKECQAISEYNIIQSEIEKNHFKNLLEEKNIIYEDLLSKYTGFEEDYKKITEEINNLKTEKHAYELSISTFRDTIEVLKKRLINSDRDVEQLKEELGKCDEKILLHEKKIMELTTQLSESQMANEEIEMQFESTSKIMQNQVKSVEKVLLDKVEVLQKELKQLLKDRELLQEISKQHHKQQSLLNKAQETLSQSSILIETLETKNDELVKELEDALKKLSEESEEAAEIRKKYIEKSGKFDELSQQFEEMAAELNKTKEMNEELKTLIKPYEQKLEAYENELKIITSEKQVLENETKELSAKYAEIVGHQNHKQKVKHLSDLKGKSSELFEKNMDLEARNFKLNKLIEKLKKEVDDLRKSGKKTRIGNEDKENVASPKCLKAVQSPGPLKEKN